MRETRSRIGVLQRLSLNALLVLALASLSESASATGASDAAIADAVRAELVDDPALPDHVLTIRVKDAVLELRGVVTSFEAKTHAISEAQTVRGVRAVVDRITVRPKTAVNDPSILNSVRDSLRFDAATEAWEIGIKVKNGVVTLTGLVDSFAEKLLAGSVAGRVAGVRDVNNRVAVDYGLRRTDQEIEHDVNQQLRWDARVDQATVNTRVKDGVVHLKGDVGSLAEREHVRFISWVAGVRDVDSSKLAVVEREDSTRQAPEEDVSDADVYAAVNDTLRWDPRVDARFVTVHVLNGKVTLRGVVTGRLAKQLAEQNARLTTGVKEVHNSIEVLPSDLGGPVPRARRIKAAFQ